MTTVTRDIKEVLITNNLATDQTSSPIPIDQIYGFSVISVSNGTAAGTTITSTTASVQFNSGAKIDFALICMGPR